MCQNVGKTDRILRVLAGLILALIAFFVFDGTARMITAVIGAVLILTGGVGYCPLYGIFRRGTAARQS
ncbi:MAG TPA: DUF2892 domain-containing protein [Limnochorda sp.]